MIAGKQITFNKENLTDEELKTLKKVLKQYKKDHAEYLTVSDKERKNELKASMANCKDSLVVVQLILVDEKNFNQRQELSRIGCEWIIEFPDILDEDGKFTGFDIIIGNPPYIQLQSMKKEADTLAIIPYPYETYARTGNIYCLFYELAYRLLKENGVLAFVTSNKWMRAGYGEALRNFLSSKTNPTHLIDFAGRIFCTPSLKCVPFIPNTRF